MATRLVVEWTRLTLRLAVAEGGSGHWRVRAIHTELIRAPEEAAETLRTLVKTAKVTPTQVIGIVAREQVITRVVKFPTQDARELAQMVELYAKAQLPYPWAQMVMDFHVVDKQQGFSTVAVVACQRDVIDRYVAVLQGAGLSAGWLTLSPWGVLGWYRHGGKAAAREEPCLVVHVDDARTDLVLIGGGRILSSRSIGQGAQDWAAGPETVELLAQEIERSRAAGRKELPDVDAKSVVLVGLGTPAPWSQALAQRLGLPVTAAEAREAFKGSLIPTAPPSSPVVVGGVAASDLRELLNLSPSELRVQVQHRQRVQELVAVGLLLLGVFTTGAALLGVSVSRDHQLAGELNRALEAVQPTTKQIQERSRAHQLVAGVLHDRRRVASTLAGIFKATPPAIMLDGVAFERGRREMVVRGSAGATQDVLEYIRQLEQVDGVGAVQLRYSTRRSTAAGERTDFELIISQKRSAS